MRGGKRKGAGAPTKPLGDKRILVPVTLHPSTVQWLKDNKALGSRGKIIEDALAKAHGLKTHHLRG